MAYLEYTEKADIAENSIWRIRERFKKYINDLFTRHVLRVV